MSDVPAVAQQRIASARTRTIGTWALGGVAVFALVAIAMQFLRTDLDFVRATLSFYLLGPLGLWLQLAYLGLAMSLALIGAGYYGAAGRDGRSAVALCLFLVLRVTALGGVATVNPLAAAGLWLAANIAGRSGALWVAVALPPARAEGASASAGALPVSRFIVGAALATLLVFVIGAPASSLLGVIVAVLAVGLVVLGWTALCRKLVGGQTGDLIGGAAGLGEIAALAVLLIFA